LSGPDLAQTVGMGQNQSGPQTQGWARTSLAQRRKNQQCRARISLARQHNIRGELFSPSPPACRTLWEKKQRKCKQLGGRKVTSRGGGVAGLAASLAVEAGGGVVAHGRRLQIVMLLLQAVKKKAYVLPFSSVLLLFFCCVSFPFFFGFRWYFFPRPDLVQSQYRFS